VCSLPLMSQVYNNQHSTQQSVYTAGHGLDWVWPFILGYPQEKIAIINDICVIHPKKELQPGTKLTIYKEHNPHAELVAVLAKFGYESEVSIRLLAVTSISSKTLCRS